MDVIVGVISDCSLSEAAKRQAEFAPLVDMFEVRLDRLTALDPEADLSTVFGKAPRPVIATCRHRAEGGNFRGDERDRLDLLQLAVAAGAAWVDLELLTELDLVRDPAETRLIRSVHQFDGATPSVDTLLSLARHAESTGADAFKFAFTARSIADCLVVRAACEHSPILAIGIAMGDLGVPTRIAYRALGSEWTYGPLPDEPGVAPGQVDVRTLRLRYRAHTLHPDNRWFGVLGNPVGHSRGVKLHNAAFRVMPGLDACYLPLLCGPDDIDGFWRFAHEFPLAGFSVTAPFKTDVIDGLDWVDPEAEAIGSVNTVVRDDNGHYHGSNTDLPGAFESLTEMLGGDDGFGGRRALVLGAGGTGRMMAYGLAKLGVEVRVYNRTRERADELVEHIRSAVPGATISATDTPAGDGSEISLLVNCTSVGMFPDVESSPLDFDQARRRGLKLAADTLVFDLIYNPAPTKFLRDAVAAGLRTLDGRPMYRRQAELQFSTWHDGAALPKPEELDEI